MLGRKSNSKIIINGLKIYAYHGKLPEEKRLGQFFLLDLSIHVDFLDNIHSDLLENTINYVDIVDFVKKKFTEKKFNLIETAAEYLCDSTLKHFPKIYKINITLKKPAPPVDANFSYVAVEVSKCREGFDTVLL